MLATVAIQAARNSRGAGGRDTTSDSVHPDGRWGPRIWQPAESASPKISSPSANRRPERGLGEADTSMRTESGKDIEAEEYPKAAHECCRGGAPKLETGTPLLRGPSPDSYGDAETVTVRPPRPSVSKVRSRTVAPSGTETGPVYRGEAAVGVVPSVV